MRALASRKRLAPLAAVPIALVAMVVTSTAPAAPVSINLCAVTGTATLTGTVTAPVWGFVLKGAQPDCSDVQGTATLPGPVLDVNKNDAVTINVTNALPAGHTLTFDAPGISFAPGSHDAAVGATLTVGFTASNPGTYLYQSSGDAGRQVAMGLAGALIVRSATAGQAYDAPHTAYTVESTMVLGAIDPAFNAAPDTFDLNDYAATYWLINGKAYPDTAGITAAAGAKVLLRYLNAGYDNTSMELLGMHERVVARDGYLLKNPYDAVAETIPAGATADAIATVPAAPAPGPNGFPLFNRNLHVTNGSSGTYASPGGALTFIHP